MLYIYIAGAGIIFILLILLSYRLIHVKKIMPGVVPSIGSAIKLLLVIMISSALWPLISLIFIVSIGVAINKMRKMQ